MAKSILHFQEVLVMTQDSGAGNLLRSGVGSQQIEAVADLLGSDHLGPAAPLQLTVWVHSSGDCWAGKLASNSSRLLAPKLVTYLSFSSSMASRLTLLLMPPSNTKTASRMPKRRRKVLNSPCSVVV